MTDCLSECPDKTDRSFAAGIMMILATFKEIVLEDFAGRPRQKVGLCHLSPGQHPILKPGRKLNSVGLMGRRHKARFTRSPMLIISVVVLGKSKNLKVQWKIGVRFCRILLDTGAPNQQFILVLLKTT